MNDENDTSMDSAVLQILIRMSSQHFGLPDPEQQKISQNYENEHTNQLKSQEQYINV